MEENFTTAESASDNYLHSVDPVHEPPVNYGHGIITPVSYGTIWPRDTGIFHLGAREGMDTPSRREEKLAA